MKIVLSTIVTLLLIGCSDSKEETTKQQVTTPHQEVVKKEEISQKNHDKKKVEEIVIAEADKVIDVETLPKNEANKTTQVVKESVPKELATVKKPDGAQLFKACSSCHGINGQKSALGKSKIIQGWSQEKILAALQGYKDGSYGGPMKGIMKGQVAKLNDAELKALAAHIASLK